MERGMPRLCRMVPAVMCLGKRWMSCYEALGTWWRALEAHVVGRRDALRFHAARKPCLFQATAANPSSVFPLVVAKTEMCCNDYKGSPLWRWLNAYRHCNSHWLSSFQTGCLLPAVAIQGLPKCWSGICSKERTVSSTSWREKWIPFPVLWVLSTVFLQ